MIQTIVMAQVHDVARVQRRQMVQQSVQVVNAGIHARVALLIMANSVVRMSPMPRLLKTAAQHAASHVMMASISLVMAVFLMIVQMAQSNAREEFHKRVPAAYGPEAQSVLLIRFVAAEAVRLVLLVSMSIRIPAKTIA